MESLDLALALELRFDSDAGENITIREYFHRLLDTLWVEGESFNGKRPFGNSGWEFDLYIPLIKAGYIYGKIDPDGFIDEIDTKNGRLFVRDLIKFAVSGR